MTESTGESRPALAGNQRSEDRLITLPDDDPFAVLDALEEHGWGDGLPVVAPTPERVERMVVASGRAPDDLVAVIPPRRGRATVEVIAANAVMAGCQAASMPVLLAAMDAMSRPEFNLTAVQATTHPVAPLLVVNGPIAADLGLNGAAGAFGPGVRANATIGRALRLVLLNVGGGTPGDGDRSTQGNPAKYSYCIAENEDRNPWGSLAQARGYRPDQSVVTVIPAEAPHNINDHGAYGSGRHVLELTAMAMSNPAANNWYSILATETWVFLGPEHAATIASAGYDRSDVQRYLYESARLPRRVIARGGMYTMREWPRWMEGDDPEARLPIVLDAQRINVLVVGGPGKHSSWAPTNGASRSVTVEVEHAV